MRILSVLVNDDSFCYAIIDYVSGIYKLADIDYANFDFLTKSVENNNTPKTRSSVPLTEYALQWNVDKISIYLADSFADFAKIPNIDDNSSAETENLIKLYLNQVYNSDEFSDFEIEMIKSNRAQGQNFNLVSFIRSNLYVDILQIFNLNNFPIIKSGTNYFNSIRAFEFNNPMLVDKMSLFLSLNKNTIISGVFQNGVISDFSINPNDSGWENTIVSQVEKHSQLDIVFVFGNSLNKAKLEFIKNTFPAIPVLRLGAFDNLTHSLDERHLDFAGRMFHNYTGVVGAVISNPESYVIGFNK